jgi:hypothetical protein
MTLMLAASAFAADVTGKWKASIEGPDGQMVITFNLKSEGTKVTGTATGPMGETPISEGTLEGDRIRFTVATEQFKILHKGTVSGDEMKLKVDIGDNTVDMTAKRVGS